MKYTRCFICNKKIKENDYFFISSFYSKDLHKKIMFFLCPDEAFFLHKKHVTLLQYHPKIKTKQIDANGKKD